MNDPRSRCQDLLRAATVALEVCGQTADGHPTRATGFFVAPGIVVTCAHVLADTRARLPANVSGRLASGRLISLETVPEWYLRAEPGGLDLAFLRAPDADDVPHVLLSGVLSLRDPMWAYGHPAGRFRAGQSAGFRYQGPSILKGADSQWEPQRLAGIPVGGGYSGSPVLNPRTGAVCGMLCTSDEAGSAHMVSADDIVSGCSPVREAQAASGANLRWLGSLSDEQISDGGWLFPGPQLRSYLDAAARAAADHPYPGVVPGVAPPPLTAVYVRQQAEPVAVAGDDPLGMASVDFDKHPAEEILSQEHDCVLVGGPGAGKSSLLRTALISLARRWQRGETAPEIPVLILASDLIAPSPLPDLITAGVNASLSAVGVLTYWPTEFFGSSPMRGTRWLILVDGLDEILDPVVRRRVLDKIAGIRLSAPEGPYRFIVATRPLADAEFPPPDTWRALRYELQLFDPGQLAEFAERWFDELGLPQPRQAARDFIAAIDRAQLADPSRTPLMATILCQLFAANPDRTLPAGRSGAYTEFVDLLRYRQYEDSVSGIYAQMYALLGPYGPSATEPAAVVLTTALDLIARLAVQRQEGGDAPAVDLLAKWTEGSRPRHVPEEKWRSFLREILRRSGLMAQRADDFQFIHQTVSEFLAASIITADRDRRSAAYNELFGRWKSGIWLPPSWDESYSRFLIAAWPDKPALTKALLRLAKLGGLPACRFIASLAADSALPDPAIGAKAAATLLRSAGDAKAEFPLRRAACEILAQLRDPRGADLLADLAISTTIKPTSRLQAAQALVRLGDGRGADLLAAQASQSEPDRLVRRWAAEALATLGDPRSADLLATIARDPAFTDGERSEALSLLLRLVGRGGRDQLAAQADSLLVLAGDAAITAGARRAVGQALAQAGDHRGIQLLAAIASHAASNASDRVAAAVILAEIGDSRGAALLVPFAVGAPTASESDRRQAASALARFGDSDMLAHLAFHTTDSSTRYRAAEALKWIGDSRHASVLALLAADPSAEAEDRLRAIRKLSRANDHRSADLAAALAAEPMVDMSVRHASALIAVSAGDRRASLLGQILISVDASRRRLATAAVARFTGSQAIGILEALTGVPQGARRAFEPPRPDDWDALTSFGFRMHRFFPDRFFPGREPARDDFPRRRAAEALACLGDPRGKDILAMFAVDPAYEVNARVDAAAMLGGIGDPRAADLLVAIIDDAELDPGQRINATKALAVLDKPRSVSSLINLLTGHRLNVDDQHRAVGVLTRLAADDESADLLATLTADGALDDHARVAAAEAMHRLGDERGARQLALLADDRTRTGAGRIEAAETLANIDISRSVPLLVSLSTDQSLPADARRCAAEVLARLRVSSTADALAVLAADTALPLFSRVEVAHALAELNDPRAGDLLKQLAEDPAHDPHARKWASDALTSVRRNNQH